MGMFRLSVVLSLLLAVEGASFVPEPGTASVPLTNQPVLQPTAFVGEHAARGGNQDSVSASARKNQRNKSNKSLLGKLTSISSMDMVTLVAARNIVGSVLRQDPYLTWQIMAPRMGWEASVMLLAQASKKFRLPLSQLIFVRFLLGSTAVVDLAEAFLVAVPNWATCGMQAYMIPRLCYSDYTVGFARMGLLLQCLISGAIYWKAATTGIHSASNKPPPNASRKKKQKVVDDEDLRAEVTILSPVGESADALSMVGGATNSTYAHPPPPPPSMNFGGGAKE